MDISQDPYANAIKQQKIFEKIKLVNNNEYNVTIKLYNDDDISVEIEDVINKFQYSVKKTAKEILELTKNSKMELDSQIFYNITIAAFSNSKDLKIVGGLDNNNLSLKICWIINEFITREFPLTLNNLNLKEVDRMVKIMKDFVTEKNTIIQNLEVRTNNIVHVSVFKDDVRREYANPVLKLVVDKKLPETKLMIQANLCVKGENMVDYPQIWNYGNANNITTTYAQTENYSDNKGHVRSIPCYCIIENHTITGPQELTLSWKWEQLKPFLVINPNQIDMGQERFQLCSIIRVEELRS